MELKISDAEWEIMKLLWEKSPQTARELTDVLGPQMNWKPKTVRTLIGRLVKKGAISYLEEGRYYYSPAIKEKEAVREERKSFLNRVYNGALMPALVQFLNEEKLTPGEIEELKKILEKKESGNDQ